MNACPSSLTTARAPADSDHIRLVGPAVRQHSDKAFHISIVGEIGPDKPASLATVKDHLACASAQRAERIHLHVDSGGGNIHEALAIFSALRAYPGTITASAHGECSSAATIIFLAGDFRAMAADTRMLIHGARVGRGDLAESYFTACTFRDHAQRLETLDGHMLDILSMRSGYHREAFATELLTETQLSAEVALSMGLVHEIESREPHCNPDWPNLVRNAAERPSVPAQYLTASYLHACRAAPLRIS
jgi:ATP-dependent protease ClpP protease subunit